MKIKSMITFLSVVFAVSSAFGAEVPEQEFKVVGTWGNAAMYRDYEKPMWDAQIPKTSDGAVTANIQPITDLGLSGSETIKLVSTGAYDAGFALYAYIVSGNPVFEGFDLALVAQSAKEQHELVNAYAPVIDEAMADIHGIKVLANYPFPLPVIACRDEFKSLADLRGKKIRVFATTQSDFAEGLGATPVSMPLGEVPTALQRGVVDCALASGIAMYNAKWFDVVQYLYQMPIGGAMAFLGMTQSKWEGLDDPTKAFLKEQSEQFEETTWAATEADEQQGIACLTGETLGGPECKHGKPADVTLVRTSSADAALREKILADYVLKRYRDRCGEDCAEQWGKIAGSAVGVSMPED